MPLTDHVTVVSDVFPTRAANDMRWPVKTAALAGDTLTVTLLVIVTLADSLVELPSVTELAVAWMVTGFVAGRPLGATYRALSGPVTAMVPRLALPFAIPFTSHVTVAPAARQNDALNVCGCPRPTLADGGEIEFVAVHVIVTFALPAAEVSATLVAVTITTAGDGTAPGAVYSAVVALLVAIVPTTELPPGTLLTLHVTPVEDPAAPVTVVVKTCPPPVGTLGDGGETVTVMSGGGGGGGDDDDDAPPTLPAHAD